MNYDLTTTIGGMRLDHPIYNASGVNCTSYQQLKELNESFFCGAIVSKSCTLENRIGNPTPRYKHFSKPNVYSINSMGIPNFGAEYYLNAREHIDMKKPYIISVAGLSTKENLDILKLLSDKTNAYDGIELNLSCPNVIGKPQTGLDFEATFDLLSKTFESFDSKCTNFGIKLPPYFDPVHWSMAGEVIDNFVNDIKFITCINSVGNALVIDPETRRTAIHPKGGFGGLGGSHIKHVALANVRAFYNMYKNKIDIVGCGGVVDGTDVIEHIICGAKAVQIGTSINVNGLKLMEDIVNKINDYFDRHHITNIDELIGTLEVADKSPEV